jgi:hypothetical protein
MVRGVKQVHIPWEMAHCGIQVNMAMNLSGKFLVYLRDCQFVKNSAPLSNFILVSYLK